MNKYIKLVVYLLFFGLLSVFGTNFLLNTFDGGKEPEPSNEGSLSDYLIEQEEEKTQEKTEAKEAPDDSGNTITMPSASPATAYRSAGSVSIAAKPKTATNTSPAIDDNDNYEEEEDEEENDDGDDEEEDKEEDD